MSDTTVDELTVGIVLDRSGSMHGIWEDTLGGVQTFVEEQVEDGPTDFYVTVFDDKVDYLGLRPYENVIPDSVAPRGMTALLDAVYTTIRRVEKDAVTKKVIIVVATDGYENRSTEVTKEQVKKLIEEKTNDGWEFVFLGANQDAWEGGRGMGISQTVQWDVGSAYANTAGYTATSKVARTYRGVT